MSTYCENNTCPYFDDCSVEYEDEFEFENKQKRRPRKDNAYVRKRKYKERIMRQMDIYYDDGTYCSHYYPAWYGAVHKNKNPHIRRWYSGDKFMKNYANRKVRRYKKKIDNGKAYRKIFDYRWWIE